MIVTSALIPLALALHAAPEPTAHVERQPPVTLAKKRKRKRASPNRQSSPNTGQVPDRTRPSRWVGPLIVGAIIIGDDGNPCRIIAMDAHTIWCAPLN